MRELTASSHIPVTVQPRTEAKGMVLPTFSVGLLTWGSLLSINPHKNTQRPNNFPHVWLGGLSPKWFQILRDSSSGLACFHFKHFTDCIFPAWSVQVLLIIESPSSLKSSLNSLQSFLSHLTEDLLSICKETWKALQAKIWKIGRHTLLLSFLWVTTWSGGWLSSFYGFLC